MNKQLSEQELSKVQDLNVRYDQTIKDLGSMQIKIRGYKNVLSQLEDEQNSLLRSTDSILQEEAELTREILEKYGTIKFDVSTGELQD